MTGFTYQNLFLKILNYLVIFINTKILSNHMSETIVTRGGQITLTKPIRDKLMIKEGDKININTMGSLIIISKKNKKAFENHDFLPDNFVKILEQIRSSPYTQRLKRLGLIR